MTTSIHHIYVKSVNPVRDWKSAIVKALPIKSQLAQLAIDHSKVASGMAVDQAHDVHLTFKWLIEFNGERGLLTQSRREPQSGSRKVRSDEGGRHADGSYEPLTTHIGTEVGEKVSSHSRTLTETAHRGHLKCDGITVSKSHILATRQANGWMGIYSHRVIVNAFQWTQSEGASHNNPPAVARVHIDGERPRE
ncbi:MAG: hypothetical protein KDI51_08375 [Xanthomonadales bacterium]|nr:hypothetical protein [Xanthomonadales bacterium]